jgi:hypothetical protein
LAPRSGAAPPGARKCLESGVVCLAGRLLSALSIMRRTPIVVIVALACLLGGRAAHAQPANPFGLGLVVGAPTGLTGKLYLGGHFALQMGLGVVNDLGSEAFHHQGLHVHIDALWHPAILTRQPAFTMPFYLGVGARIVEYDHHYRFDGRWVEHDDTRLGVRVPFGLLMDFNRVPLDLFLELAVVIDVLELEDVPFHGHDHHRVVVNGGLGVRYYF